MEPRLAVNNDQGPGPPISTKDWVSPLPIGTRFLCIDKRTKAIMELEVLARSTSKYVKIIDNGDTSVVWHDPKAFCFQKDLLDILED